MPRPLLDPVITPVGVARCPWKLASGRSQTRRQADFNANALTHIANAASGSDPVETLNGTATGHFILGERFANAYAHQFMFGGRHSTAVAGKSCEIRGWLLSQLQVPQAPEQQRRVVRVDRTPCVRDQASPVRALSC